MPPASNCLQYRLKKPIDLMNLFGGDLRWGIYMPDLSTPVWLVSYVIHNMQHSEFTKSRKPESEVGTVKEPTRRRSASSQLHCTIFVHVPRVEGAGESIKISMLLIVVYRKSESRELDTSSMFHLCLVVDENLKQRTIT